MASSVIPHSVSTRCSPVIDCQNSRSKASGSSPGRTSRPVIWRCGAGSSGLVTTTSVAPLLLPREPRAGQRSSSTTRPRSRPRTREHPAHSTRGRATGESRRRAVFFQTLALDASQPHAFGARTSNGLGLRIGNVPWRASSRPALPRSRVPALPQAEVVDRHRRHDEGGGTVELRVARQGTLRAVADLLDEAHPAVGVDRGM